MSRELYLRDCGVITALGNGKQAVARALLSGSEHRLSERDDLLSRRTVRVGAVPDRLPRLPANLATYDSRNNRLMWAALREIEPAIEDARARYGRDRIAVVLGTSTAGIGDGEIALAARRLSGDWPHDFDYRMQETGGLAESAARLLGLTGAAYTVATACSSSAKVFASARRLIRAGFADAAVVGGADTLCRMTLGGFAALEALSRGRCNPFSLNRDGITIGEGAAAFLLDSVQGSIRLLGLGESSDAYHSTAPDPEGHGAREAMALALADADLTSAEIAYVNLHGTGTLLNDAMEARAVAGLFPQETPCSSTKAMTGHMLGAAGACEAAFLWLTLNPATNPEGYLPPHVWDGVTDPSLPPLNLVAKGARLPGHGSSPMLSTSFGFGGSNIALILARAA